jgi:hypothetical protein
MGISGDDAILPYRLIDWFCQDLLEHGGIPIFAPFSAAYEEVAVEKREQYHRHVFLSDFGERILTTSQEARLDVEPGDEILLGQKIGVEPISVPENFAKFSPTVRGQVIQRQLGYAFRPLLREWFGRQQCEFMEGFIHMPLALSSTVATRSHPDKMAWRMETCGRWWSATSEAYVFPSVAEYPPGSFSHEVRTLKTELCLDLAPYQKENVPVAVWPRRDDRFLGVYCPWFGRTREYEIREERKELTEEVAVCLKETAEQEAAEIAAKLEKARLLAAAKMEADAKAQDAKAQ